MLLKHVNSVKADLFVD